MPSLVKNLPLMMSLKILPVPFIFAGFFISSVGVLPDLSLARLAFSAASSFASPATTRAKSTASLRDIFSSGVKSLLPLSDGPLVGDFFLNLLSMTLIKSQSFQQPSNERFLHVDLIKPPQLMHKWPF